MSNLSRSVEKILNSSVIVSRQTPQSKETNHQQSKSPFDLSFSGKRNTTQLDLHFDDYYRKKMKYVEEKSFILAEARKKQDRNDLRTLAGIPKINERSKKLAELHRLKEKLIDDERFIKRIFDREKNQFEIRPNPEYQYTKNDITKTRPVHWTFQDYENSPDPMRSQSKKSSRVIKGKTKENVKCGEAY